MFDGFLRGPPTAVGSLPWFRGWPQLLLQPNRTHARAQPSEIHAIFLRNLARGSVRYSVTAIQQQLNQRSFMKNKYWILGIAIGSCLIFIVSSAFAQYLEHDLTGYQSGLGFSTDPNLNGWGMVSLPDDFNAGPDFDDFAGNGLFGIISAADRER